MRGMGGRTPRWAAVLFALAVGAAAVHADPTLARRYYAEGEAAFGGGRFAEAARAFEAAFAESKHPSLLWNIAQSYRRQYEVDRDLVNLRRAGTVYRNF